VRLRPGVIFGIVCFVVSAGAARADSVSVENSSFETANPLTVSCGSGCAYNQGPIPGWTITGAGGSWQSSSTYYNLPLPQGNIVAYSNGGTISQILSASVLPDSTYTLSVYVGDRLDGFVTDYSIALYDGSSVLCSSPTASNGTITPGTFADVILTCSTGGMVSQGDLGIVFDSGGSQIDIDDVTLNVAPAPEPATCLLLFIGLGSMLLFYGYRRTEVSS
jgi:hypothetical protein